jgi:hypothetical protein
MGFGSGGVWGMGYGRFMGYAMHFPTNQLGGPKMLWGLRGYGFSEVWVKRGSTVPRADGGSNILFVGWIDTARSMLAINAMDYYGSISDY